jgi:hypothetical protein
MNTNRKYQLLGLVGLALLASPALSAGLHKCTNADGNTSYSDKPCPKTAKPASLGTRLYKCATPGGSVSYSDKPCPRQAQTLKEEKLSSFRIGGHVGDTEFVDDNPTPDAPALFLFRSRFSNILNSLTPLRMLITQYYMERREWPKSLDDLGFEPQSMHSSQIEQVRIMKHGKIVAALKPRLGANKYLILNPRPALGETQIEWQCWSNFPRLLLGGGEMELCTSRIID